MTRSREGWQPGRSLLILSLPLLTWQGLRYRRWLPCKFDLHGSWCGSVANYRKQESLDSQAIDFQTHDVRILPRKGNFATELSCPYGAPRSMTKAWPSSVPPTRYNMVFSGLVARSCWVGAVRL